MQLGRSNEGNSLRSLSAEFRTLNPKYCCCFLKPHLKNSIQRPPHFSEAVSPEQTLVQATASLSVRLAPLINSRNSRTNKNSQTCRTGNGKSRLSSVRVLELMGFELQFTYIYLPLLKDYSRLKKPREHTNGSDRVRSQSLKHFSVLK